MRFRRLQQIPYSSLDVCQTCFSCRDRRPWLGGTPHALSYLRLKDGRDGPKQASSIPLRGTRALGFSPCVTAVEERPFRAALESCKDSGFSP